MVGISSLASGADQLFAESVIERGGTFEAIIPFPEYETRFSLGVARERYQALLAKAIRATVLERVGTDDECYYAAGTHIVDSCDVLLAVWDSGPARGLGGTGDIVRYARRVGRPVVHIDPVKLSVTRLVDEPFGGRRTDGA